MLRAQVEPVNSANWEFERLHDSIGHCNDILNDGFLCLKPDVLCGPVWFQAQHK